MRWTKRKTGLLLACSTLAACDMSLDVRTLTDLEAAQARWEDVRPDAYVFAVRRMCYCPLESIGPVRLRVQGDDPVERAYVPSGDPVPSLSAHLFPTVDGLFEIVREAIDAEAHELTVSYDPDTGVPTELWIDYEEMMVDEELGFEITEGVTAVP